MSSREEIKVYQLNEEEAEFEELELDADVNYSDLFNSKVILLFIREVSLGAGYGTVPKFPQIEVYCCKHGHRS